MLGHGVNLPCETLLFAETTKFDGKERRNLLPWEIAQIAGRAGRYGFHERGHVGVLTGVPWADPDPELVRDALVPHVTIEGGQLGYRVVETGRIRPQLSDLNVSSAGRDRAGAARVAAGGAPLLERTRAGSRSSRSSRCSRVSTRCATRSGTHAASFRSPTSGS